MSNLSLEENIFSVLQRGDRKIKLAQRKAIIFVGLTRVGKSTAFNWALKKQMVGVGNLKSYYVNSVADNDVAVVGESFASVTLAPNIYVNYEEGISMIDMAGYFDTRNYVGVIGVSYFLKALFQQVKEAKFVIVMDENKLMQSTCQGLIKTFNGFINMFHFDLMTPQIKAKLMDSLTLLITRSKQSQSHYEYIDHIVHELKNQELKAENKELIIQILQGLRGSARIEPFQAAKNNKNPQECTFISRFTNAKGWNYFDFSAAQESLNGQSLISLPFKADFAQLSQPEQQIFTRKIEEKIASYLGFSKIIKCLVETYNSNWQRVLNNWRENKEYNVSLFDMTNLFVQAGRFVQTNDVYNSKESIQTTFKINYEAPTFIQSIKTIVDIQDVIDDICFNNHDFGNQEEGFKAAMQFFNTQFSKITRLLRIFCRNQEEEQLILKVQYILCRGFRQFQKLYQLDGARMAGARQGLKDTCNQVFDDTPIVFIQKVISHLNSQLLTKIFSSVPLLEEYSEFICVYEKRFNQKSPNLTEQDLVQNQTFVNRQKFYIEMAKSDLLLSVGKKIEALNCYINGFQKIMQIGGDVTQVFMIKLKMVKKIVSILKNFPKLEHSDLKQYALQLCHKYKLIQQTGLIYQSMIDSASTFQKLKILEDYARFSAKWGYVEEALKQLRKKLSLQDESHEGFLETIALMKEVVKSRQKYFDGLEKELSSLERIQQNDKDVCEILKEIAVAIKQLADQE